MKTVFVCVIHLYLILGRLPGLLKRLHPQHAVPPDHLDSRNGGGGDVNGVGGGRIVVRNVCVCVCVVVTTNRQNDLTLSYTIQQSNLHVHTPER